jgi:MFS family permease
MRFVVVALFGAFYAATDGVLAAMASATLGAELRTSGLALLNTATSLSRLVSSILFGWLWTSGTMRTAVWTFLLGLSAAVIISALILAEKKRE